MGGKRIQDLDQGRGDDKWRFLGEKNAFLLLNSCINDSSAFQDVEKLGKKSAKSGKKLRKRGKKDENITGSKNLRAN